MRNNPTLKRQWARILESGKKFRPVDSDKFTIYYGHRTTMFGRYAVVMGSTKELIESAKQAAYRETYLHDKMRLRKMAGVELGAPEWVIKTYEGMNLYDPLHRTIVGWKAETDRKISNEAYRRIALAQKRAMKPRRKRK